MEQYVLLMLVVFIPPVISVGLIALAMGRGDWKGARWRSILTLHPESGLVHQGLLWVSISIPFLYFMLLGALAWRGFDISLDADGFKKFIEISVLPLAALSISLPLAGLVSKLHSTQQTAVQISVVCRKNNFDAFYSHRKELFSYFAQIGSLTYLGCLVGEYKVHPKAHQMFFAGDPKNGIPEPKLQAFESIRGDLNSILMMLNTVISGDDDNVFDYYLNACNNILSVAQRLGVPEVYIGMVEKGASFSVNYGGRGLTPVATVGTTTAEILASVRYLRNYFNNLCAFAAGLTPSVTECSMAKLHRGGERAMPAYARSPISSVAGTRATRITSTWSARSPFRSTSSPRLKLLQTW